MLPYRHVVLQYFVRAMFDYLPDEDNLLPCRDIGLTFKHGDILEVSESTMIVLYTFPRLRDRCPQLGVSSHNLAILVIFFATASANEFGNFSSGTSLPSAPFRAMLFWWSYRRLSHLKLPYFAFKSCVCPATLSPKFGKIDQDAQLWEFGSCPKSAAMLPHVKAAERWNDGKQCAHAKTTLTEPCNQRRNERYTVARWI